MSTVCDCGISWSYSLTIIDLRFHDGSDSKTYLKMRGLGPDVVSVVKPTGFNCWISFTPVFSCIFLHGNSLREAVWSCKIQVQIMRFTCCLNMAFTWKGLNWALICMHDVTRESVAAVTDHFADAFVRENIARVYMTLRRRNDVRKFDADAILFWEIKCKKRDI